MKFYDEDKLQDFQAGKISANWKVVEIKDIATVKEGIYGKRSDNGDILQLKADSIQDDGKINNQAFARITIDRIANDYLLSTGDVLLNNRNSSALVGKSAIYRGEFSKCVFGNLLTRIRIHSKDVLPEWLLYMLMQLHSQGFLRAISTRAVNQALLKKGTVEKIEIPMPPISEQHSVMKVLSVVDSVIELADKVTAKTERLKKGLMERLLTKGIAHEEYKDTLIGKIPKDWETTKLSELSEHITKGTTPTTYGFRYTASGVNFIKVESIDEHGVFIPENITHTSEEANKAFSRSILREKDVLFSIAGALGRVAVVTNEVLPANTNQALAIIRLRNNNRILVEYLRYFLMGSQIQNFVRTIAIQSQQANLNLEHVRNFLVVLPPPQEQKEISEILSTVNQKLGLERREKSGFVRVRRGLMDLLLTGKVRIRGD